MMTKSEGVLSILIVFLISIFCVIETYEWQEKKNLKKYCENYTAYLKNEIELLREENKKQEESIASIIRNMAMTGCFDKK